MVAPRSKQFDVSGIILGSGPGSTTNGQLGWATGLGALTHVLGPSDQNLSVQAGASRAIVAGPSLNVGTGVTPSTENGDIVAGDGTNELLYDASAGVISSISDSTISHSSAPTVSISTEKSGGLNQLRYRSSATSGGVQMIATRSRGTTAAPAATASDDLIYQVAAQMFHTSSLTKTAAGVNFFVDGTPGATNAPGRIDFLTIADGDASMTLKRRMRIRNSGGVVIGDVDLIPARLTAALGDLVVGDGTREFDFDASGGFIRVSGTGGTSNRTIITEKEGDYNRLQMVNYSNVVADNCQILTYKRGGTIATPLKTPDSSTVFTISAGGYVDATTSASFANISIAHDGLGGSIAPGNAPGQIIFNTNSGASGLNRWSINRDGHFSVASPTGDNVIDIGSNDGTGTDGLRPRRIFVGTEIVVTSGGTTIGNQLIYGGGIMQIGGASAAADLWEFHASNNYFGPTTDSAADIGRDGNSRPDNIYVASSLVIGTSTVGLTATTSSIDRGSSGGTLTVGGTNADAVDIGVSGRTTTIKGDLVVDGTTTSVDSETVLIADNHLYLNKDYVTTSAQTGGLVVNYLPTATSTTSATGGFADTDTVNVANTAGFAVGMFIQVSGAADVTNDGLYEIGAIGAGAPGTIDIATAPTHEFCQTAFAVDATDTTAVITNINVSALQCKTTGTWEQGAGGTEAALTSALTELGAGGGAVTGDTSVRVPTVDAISGVTQATSTTVSSFNVRSHPDESETGQQFEFKVPDDYDSGDITINVTYRMSTVVASPNNVVRVETAAEIAPAAGGTIDVASYGLAQSDLTTLENVNWSRVTVLTLTEGDFATADSILVKVKRRGTHANDDHTGAFQIMTYDFAYTSQTATREVTQNITIFDASDETSATAGTKSSFNTLDYSGSATNEQQFQVIVPDNWDQASDLHIQATYAMGAAEASKTVLLRTEYEVADVSGGSITVSGTEDHTEYPANDTNVRRTVSLRGIPAADIGVGDSILVKLKRLGGTDTHTSTFQLIAVSVYTGVAPKTGFSEVTITQDYLEAPVFNQVSGTTSSDLEYPTFSGDFETWAFMTSTTAVARIDVGFSGRLTDGQTSLAEIKVPIKGNAGAQYNLKVYAEGSGATPVYTSGLTAAPTSRTVLTLLSGALSAQPTGEKRYHVVVEATLDNTEELRVGMPFVKQE